MQSAKATNPPGCAPDHARRICTGCLWRTDWIIAFVNSSGGVAGVHSEVAHTLIGKRTRGSFTIPVSRSSSVTDYGLVETLLGAAGPAVKLESSAGREFSFVLSHTIHHDALVGVIVRSLGREPPVEFGCAPSTLRYKAGRLCAR